jgi:hypothetical protein
MAEQETGEEILIADKILHEHNAYMVIAARLDAHPEYRRFWVERERDYYAEAAERYYNDEQDLY